MLKVSVPHIYVFNSFMQRIKHASTLEFNFQLSFFLGLYLDTPLVELRELGIGCHTNGLFIGAFIYADDITFIAPSCYALNSMLNVCEEYAFSQDILFNSLKTK